MYERQAFPVNIKETYCCYFSHAVSSLHSICLYMSAIATQLDSEAKQTQCTQEDVESVNKVIYMVDKRRREL